MSKILITGVNGFVGQHVAQEFADNGMEVIGVGGRQGSREKLSSVSQYFTLDLMQSEAAAQIPFEQLDGVVHLAGLAAVGASFDQPHRYISTNTGIEINLFEAALAQKANPRFLIISSGSLYDPKASLPFTETSAVKPSSPYAVSKLGQEELGSYYSSRGFECIIARPFNHIGPGQGPGFIVPDLTRQIIAGERRDKNEVLVGNLDAKRDYTDVRDIARSYRLLLEEGRAGEIYNICSGRALSGHEILAGILAVTGSSPVIKQDPSKMRPSDNPSIYGSHKKITEDTGWKPRIPIEETLAAVVADWRSRS